MSEQNAREGRLARAAYKAGLQLKKGRRRDTYGTYMLIDAATNALVAGDHQNGYGLTLDDVERALTERSVETGRRAP